MHKMFRTAILITFGMLISGIISGCGDDNEIKLLDTVPEDGGTVSVSGELEMVFDGFPTSVTVDGKEATIGNNTAIVQIADLFDGGTDSEKTVVISWADPGRSFVGTQTITLTLESVAEASSGGFDATRVVVNPPPRDYYIPTDTTFTLMLDAGVRAVWVNHIAAVGVGQYWQVANVLEQGVGQDLDINWLNRNCTSGSQVVGPYSVMDFQPGPPAITHGTVFDGESDVDPAPINLHGLWFDFNEAVTGTLKLTDEAGVDLNWIGIVRDKTAILAAVAGQELVNETTYKIDVDVQDSDGNPLQTTITFVTKPK